MASRVMVKYQMPCLVFHSYLDLVEPMIPTEGPPDEVGKLLADRCASEGTAPAQPRSQLSRCHGEAACGATFWEFWNDLKLVGGDWHMNGL